MITSTKKMRFLSLALAGALSVSLLPSVIADVAAAEQNAAAGAKVAQPSGGGTSRANNNDDTSGWEVVHRGKIKNVTVTTTDGDGNTHTGCHDHENGVSTPGPC